MTDRHGRQYRQTYARREIYWYTTGNEQATTLSELTWIKKPP